MSGCHVIYARKTTTPKGTPVFLPASATAERAMREIPDGKVVRCARTEDRNWRLHDKYFAVLSLIWNNQEQFKTSEQLREATLIEIGYREMREKFNGERYYVAGSMATGRLLPGWTIDKIYNDSLNAWCQHFGHDRETLENELRAVA